MRIPRTGQLGAAIALTVASFASFTSCSDDDRVTRLTHYAGGQPWSNVPLLHGVPDGLATTWYENTVVPAAASSDRPRYSTRKGDCALGSSARDGEAGAFGALASQ